MIDCLHLVRNIGQFDSVAAANIRLSRYVLVFAENGRGKTTLTAILRSLATGDPLQISERRRLTTRNPPHVVLECSGGPPNAMFQGGAWNRTVPDLLVFDDRFVDENVHSGLVVDPEHRQNLHELILGAQGVNLNRQVQDAVGQIVLDNASIRTAGEAVPVTELHGFSLDQFCALQPVADVDAAITTAEQVLRTARRAGEIQQGSLFAELALPPIDVASLNAVLSQDLEALDAASVERVHRHCEALGDRGEEWVSEGMQMLRAGANDENCPFCEQPLRGSPSIDDFRDYFGDEYARLKQAISESIAGLENAHGGEAPAVFERAVRIAQDTQRFWADFTNIEPFTVDAALITRDRLAASNAALQTLTAKRGAPLEQRLLSATAVSAIESFNAHCAAVAELNRRLDAVNLEIGRAHV